MRRYWLALWTVLVACDAGVTGGSSDKTPAPSPLVFEIVSEEAVVADLGRDRIVFEVRDNLARSVPRIIAPSGQVWSLVSWSRHAGRGDLSRSDDGRLFLSGALPDQVGPAVEALLTEGACPCDSGLARRAPNCECNDWCRATPEGTSTCRAICDCAEGPTVLAPRMPKEIDQRDPHEDQDDDREIGTCKPGFATCLP